MASCSAWPLMRREWSLGGTFPAASPAENPSPQRYHFSGAGGSFSRSDPLEVLSAAGLQGSRPDCCRGPFPSNLLDARRLQRDLAALAGKDPERAETVRRRAKEAAQRLAGGFPGDAATGRLGDDDEAEERFWADHGLDNRRQEFKLRQALSAVPGLGSMGAGRQRSRRSSNTLLPSRQATVVGHASQEAIAPRGPSPDERRRLESTARQLEGPLLGREVALRVASTLLLNMASARPADYVRPEAEAKSRSMWDYEAIRAALVGVLEGAPTRDETGDLHPPRMVRPKDMIAAAKLIDAHDTEVEGKAPAPVNIAVLVKQVSREEAKRGLAVFPDGRWIASVGDEAIHLWPMPDVSKRPLHTLPHAELLAKLDALTNLRVVRDPAAATGWKDVPTW